MAVIDTVPPYSKEDARAKTTALVEQFRANEAALQNEAEAQIENDYIRPLFRYLNWNVDNENLPKPQREFLLQNTSRDGRRPDYLLRLEGQHLLFMDAKKVKYDMHDPRWLWQVYRYAHSTQIPSQSAKRVDFALLTDFQEFVLVDCTFTAKEPEAVSNFRVPSFDLHYSDYVTKFDHLWAVFERNNMLAASRARKSGLWSLYLSPKQAKANRIPPDEGFLDMLDNAQDGWRVRLAKDMKACDARLTGEVITAAVQLLIDRLVFIKALSDRNIEEDYISKLAEVVESDGLEQSLTSWFKAARPIFDRLNKFYNGSMFAPRPELDAVATSNRVIRQLIRELDSEHSPYDLSVLPVEILGTIYERFLGKVVRTTDQRVRVEEKPEVRKAGGVYYTPQWVVSYIVQQTVVTLLKRCKTPDQVAKLKVLDPACGSGSFLLCAYDVLIEWHKSYYSKRKRLDRWAAFRDFDGDVQLSARLKKQLLLNNIFGVDIDQQAVEVTRFSLSLKALEETNREELDDERTFWKDTVLPDLSKNVVCGNSLIGTDILHGQLFPSEEERRLNPMDYERRFQALVPPGFDVVLGNPPWGASFDEHELAYMRVRYQRVIARMVDSYIYFIDKALGLARKEGMVGFVIPSTLLNQVDAKPVRALLLSHGLSSLISLGTGVFGSKVLNTSTIFVSGRRSDGRLAVADLSNCGPAEREKRIVVESSSAWNEWAGLVKRDGHLTFFVKGRDATSLLMNLRGRHPALGSLFPGGIQRGVSPDIAEAHVVSRPDANRMKLERDLLRPGVSGPQIKRYQGWKSDQFIIYTTRDTEIRKFPRVAKYLDRFRVDNSCPEVRDGKHPWWALHRPRDPRIFAAPKIIGLTTAKTIELIYDETQGVVVTDAMYVFTPPADCDAWALMAVMQSRLFLFLYRTSNQGESRVIPQIKASKLDTLPFPSCKRGTAASNKLSGLAADFLEAKKRLIASKTEKDRMYYADKCAGIDGRIDAEVFALYRLAPADAKTVGTSMSDSP